MKVVVLKSRHFEKKVSQTYRMSQHICHITGAMLR